MRIVVIGGTAFMGPFMVQKLVSLGHEVTVFHRGKTSFELPPGVNELLGDREDLSALSSGSFDVAVHMVTTARRHAEELVRAFGPETHLVVASSVDVYRAYGVFIGKESGLEPAPVTEESPVRTIRYPYADPSKPADDFMNLYDKLDIEEIVLTRGGATVRLPMTYGPRDWQRRLKDYVARMSDDRPYILLSEPMPGWRAPRGYAQNMGEALALVADRKATGMYNAADRWILTEEEWVRKIAELMDWHGQILAVPAGELPDDHPVNFEQDLCADSTKIRRELGFSESVDLEEGIRRTITWELEQPREDLTEAYLKEDQVALRNLQV